MLRRVAWENFDYWLLGLVVTLIIFGTAMIRSAIAGNAVLAELPNRQLVFATVGLVAMLALALMDYHHWLPLSKYLYVLTVITLIALKLVGTALFGSARWFTVGPIKIQPSEFAKIVLILVQAGFLARYQDRLHQLRWVLLSAALTGGLVVWVLLQPDLSTSITLVVIWLAMLWAAGLRWKHIGLFVGVGSVASIVGFPFLADYQKARILNFLFPDETARHGAIYNVLQALISIGSGGWFGHGYGQGPQVQYRFLKVRHTDFIFAVIAHELGFVGAVLTIVLLSLVIWRCLRIAQRAYDTFGALIATGVAAMLGFHMMVNIAMNLNLIPVTGLPLPFITYGGSTLVSTLLAIGLVESVALYRRPLEP